MKTTERVLLAQRNDGKFLRLDEHHFTTGYDYVGEPELAKRINPYDEEHYSSPKEAPYYFENSSRARDLWLKNCRMVPYEITTEIIATELERVTDD